MVNVRILGQCQICFLILGVVCVSIIRYVKPAFTLRLKRACRATVTGKFCLPIGQLT